MINIELDFNVDIQVFISNQETTARRIGDVVLLEKDTEEFKPRYPWNLLFTASNYILLSGNKISENRSRNENNIILESSKYNLSNIIDLTYGKEFMMALLQRDKLYLCDYCKIDGSELNDEYLSIEINIKKSEFIDEK